jgi:hypothetical protein
MPIVKHEDGTLRYKSAEYWIPKPWVGLTNEEIDWILDLAYADDMELIKTIEAKLKEKNT